MLTYNQFPVFTANQVLRHDHLNDLLNYLDEQGRFTRTRLSGIGIICGYQIELGKAIDGANREQTALRVSAGTGVTSRGYLANTTAQSFTGVMPYTIEQEFSRLENDLRQDVNRNNRLGLYKELTEVYPFFLEDDGNNADLVELFELIPDVAANDDAQPFDANFLEDKVLLVYVKQDLQALKNCDTNDCNDKGARLDTQVRFLLTNRDNAGIIRERELMHHGEHVAVHTDLHPRYTQPVFDQPALKKVRIRVDTQDWNSLQTAYRNVTRSAFSVMSSKIESSLQHCNYLLSEIYPNNARLQFGAEFLDLTKGLEAAYQTGQPLQNYYDFAATLQDAYREFAEAADNYRGICQADPQQFPKHLMLGELAGIDKDPKDGWLERASAITSGSGYFPTSGGKQAFRHYFIPSVALNDRENDRRLVWSLHFRLLMLLKGFNALVSKPTNLPDIRLVPSRSKLSPLSERAIPVYLPSQEEFGLLSLWNFRKTTRQQLATVYAYDRLGQGFHPLALRQTEVDFYRIEGHLGRSLTEVNTKLWEEKRKLGLDFCTEIVHLGEGANQNEFQMRLADFSQLHPGLEHQGGVPKGGTFVIAVREIKGEEVVVADFALPYYCARNVGRNFVLQRCVYKWISSSKYLMNLTRPKKGVSILYRDYTLRVTGYEIDGISILRGGKTVRISIRELKYAGMRAVTEGLNAAFPTGLIFDTTADRDRIAIKKYAGQTFRLEIQDVKSKDRYEYTEKGRRINNSQEGDFYKPVECSLLPPKYDPDAYRHLHYSLPRDNDYQVVLPTNEDWRDWNKALGTRSIESITDDRLSEIRETLYRINNQLEAIVADTRVYLTGSWQKGTAASVIDIREGKDIVGLREKLYGKQGSSDIDLIIELPKGRDHLGKSVKARMPDYVDGYKVNLTFGSPKRKEDALEIKRDGTT